MSTQPHKCEFLAREIKKNFANTRAGTRMPSIRQIAQKYGISPQVASQAYQVLCNQGCCTASARSGIYWNALPQEQLEQKKYRIGCILRTIKKNGDNPKTVQMVQHFDHYAWCLLQDMGHELVFFNPENLSKGIVADSMLNDIDGWLLSCMDFNIAQNPDWLQRPPRPTVIFRHQHIVNYPVSQVLPDHYSGIREMFRCALEFDLKGVTIVTPDFPSCVARGKICAEIAEANHLKIKEFITKHISCDFNELGHKLNVKGQLVFCSSDLPAFDLYQGLCQTGLKPNGDFHFVSDDDVESLGIRPLTIPTLSSITYSRKKQTELAVNLLLKNISEPTDITHIELVPTHFVRRVSGLNHVQNNEHVE